MSALLIFTAGAMCGGCAGALGMTLLIAGKWERRT